MNKSYIFFLLVFLFVYKPNYGQKNNQKSTSGEKKRSEYITPKKVNNSISPTDNTLSGEATGKNEKIEVPGLPIFPSPKVKEMMKYTDFPTVDQFGCAPIEIPIYEIKSRDINHPIKLSYHSGGITVNQEATWVGLGWNLEAGGSISRVVMGLPDDEKYVGTYSMISNCTDYDINYTHYGWICNPDMIENFPELDLSSSTWKTALLDDWDPQYPNRNAGISFAKLNYHDFQENQVLHDCEPDVFYLNVGDLKVKFILGFDGLPKLLNSEDKVSISYTKDSGNGINIVDFVVIDQKGVKYYFGGSYLEKSTVTTTYQPPSTEYLYYTSFNSTFNLSGQCVWDYCNYNTYNISKEYTSSWFLEKIESPNGNEITFSYSPSTPNGERVSVPVTKADAYSIGINNFWNNVVSINQKIDTWYLNNIYFTGGLIEFITSARSDFENGSKLDEIKVYDDNMVPVFDFDFVYNYMNNGGNFNTKRLVLSELIKNGIDNYSFGYYPGSLPAKDSYFQDFWGYFSNNSTGFVPKVYVYPNADIGNRYRCFPITGESGYELAGSNRQVDINSIYTGSLRSIKYPTGGKTLYEYEPNDYYDESYGGNILGGGIRIKCIKKTDYSENVYYQKTYNYNNGNTSSGILIYDLAYATPTTYRPNGSTGRSSTYSFIGTYGSQDYHENFTVRFTHNVYPNGNIDGKKVGYTMVETIETGNGKIVREYYPPLNYKANASEVKNTPTNAWDFSISELSSPEIILCFYEGEYTKTCEYDEENDNYYFVLDPRSGWPVTENCYSCNYSDNEVVISYNEMHYYGGGGVFHPTHYTPGYTSTFQEYIFNQTGNWDFHVFKWQDNNSFEGPYYGETNLELHHSTTYHYDITSWGEVVNGSNIKNVYPFPNLSDDLLTNPDNHDMIHSKLKNELYYKEGEGSPCKKKEYFYYLYDNSERIFGIKYTNQFVVPNQLLACPIDASGNSQHNLNKGYFYQTTHSSFFFPIAYSKYYYNTNCVALVDKIIETDYYNAGNIEKVTTMEYDNNLLLSSKLESQSSETNKTQETTYPQNYQVGIYNNMQTAGMNHYPIENVTLIGDEVVDGTIQSYGSDGNCIVPLKYYKFASDVGVPYSSCGYDGTNPNESYWTLVAHYIDYDDKGNLVQYKLKDNYNITFLWGYNYSEVIAKIENAAFSDVMNALGVTYSQLQLKSSAELLGIFESLRQHVNMNEAKIYSYTYDKLVGMASETDPSGRTTRYNYDNAGRLVSKINHEGHIMEFIKYEYSSN